MCVVYLTHQMKFSGKWNASFVSLSLTIRFDTFERTQPNYYSLKLLQNNNKKKKKHTKYNEKTIIDTLLFFPFRYGIFSSVYCNSLQLNKQIENSSRKFHCVDIKKIRQNPMFILELIVFTVDCWVFQRRWLKGQLFT